MRALLLELADQTRNIALVLMAAGIALEVGAALYAAGYDAGWEDAPTSAVTSEEEAES